jgi:hypothetical protein
MSDAELTIKHQILFGFTNLLANEVLSPKEVQNAIFDEVFHPTTLWAVKEYLDERQAASLEQL